MLKFDNTSTKLRKFTGLMTKATALLSPKSTHYSRLTITTCIAFQITFRRSP